MTKEIFDVYIQYQPVFLRSIDGKCANRGVKLQKPLALRVMREGERQPIAQCTLVWGLWGLWGSHGLWGFPGLWAATRLRLVQCKASNCVLQVANKVEIYFAERVLSSKCKVVKVKVHPGRRIWPTLSHIYLRNKFSNL